MAKIIKMPKSATAACHQIIGVKMMNGKPTLFVSPQSLEHTQSALTCSKNIRTIENVDKMATAWKTRDTQVQRHQAPT